MMQFIKHFIVFLLTIISVPEVMQGQQQFQKSYGFTVITTVTITSGGTTYSANGSHTAVNLTGGTGTGAKATITVTAGVITAVSITTTGSGYSNGDVLTPSVGTGSPALAHGAGSNASFTATGFTGSEEGYAVVECTDGDFVLSGNCSAQAGDAMLMKISSAGDIIRWANSFGGAQNDANGAYSAYQNYVVQSADGGYIIAGFLRESSGVSPGMKMWLTKSNASGAFQWGRKYGNCCDLDGTGQYPSDIGYSVKSTTDGGYIFVGAVNGGPYAFPNEFDYDAMMVKVSSSGVLQWKAGFGASNSDQYAICVVEATDGGYVIAGRTGTGPPGMYIAKRTNAGAAVLAKKIDDASGNGGEVYDITKSTDGGYVLMGYGGASGLPALVKTNNVVNTTAWSKTYSISGATSQIFNRVIRTSDGGYAVAMEATLSGNKDAILLKIDANGGYQWGWRYGGTDVSYGNDVFQTSDGGYALCGTSTPNANFGTQLFLVKTDNVGSSGVGTCTKEIAIPSASVTITNINYNTYTNIGDAHTTNMTYTVSYGSFNSRNENIVLNCDGTVLPVELLTFSGNNTHGQVILNWSTASENNNDYFVVERNHTNGMGGWENIGIVKGGGYSNFTRHYEFTDPDPPESETLYYRLKQTDYNGQYEYFGPVAISRVASSNMYIHTNTTNHQILVSFPDELGNKNCSVKVYDISGRLCFQTAFIPDEFKNQHWINASAWDKGVYIVSASCANGISLQKKFIKQ